VPTIIQGSKLRIVPPDVGELGASSDNSVVHQLFAFPSTATRCQDHHLPIAHGFRVSKSKDPGRLKLRGKDIGKFTDMHRRDDEDKNTSDLQPAVRVRQEHPFRALASNFASGPVVRRIQERQPAGLDGAVHVEAVAMNHLIDNSGSLYRAIRIQLDSVPARARFFGNG
jgi:hypothetical protein